MARLAYDRFGQLGTESVSKDLGLEHREPSPRFEVDGKNKGSELNIVQLVPEIFLRQTGNCQTLCY